jgi:CubicO group peptidase (beta-lactamase class C family)
MTKNLNILATLAAVAGMTFFTAVAARADEALDQELDLVAMWLDAERAYDGVPGLSAAIVRDQDLLWSGSFGLADVASERPARDDTIYGICSISKLFTGIAAMQLRDQGRMRLDDPVDKLLPWYNLEQAYEDSPPVTLESLLTHSSGLPRESDTPYWMGPDFVFPSREEVRALLGTQSTLYPAQRYFQYSNLGLTLVGEIVAQQSGEDFASYVKRHILQPLQLNDTSIGFPTDDREPRVATGYGFPGRAGPPPPMPRYDTRGIAPAAGFASTALDLARFAAWQFRLLGGGAEEVLKANTLREMQRVQWMDQDWSVARGLAFGVYRLGDRTVTGHAGDCPGFNTRLFLDPVARLAVIVMANRNLTDVDGYAATIFDILEAGGSAGSPEVPDATNLADYVGSYDGRPWHGEDIVFRWEDGLGLASLPTPDPLADMVLLRRVEGDRFRTVRSDGTLGHEVAFRRDPEGRVSHMVYHSLPLPRLTGAVAPAGD